MFLQSDLPVRAATFLMLAASLLAGCARHAAPYVWVDRMPTQDDPAAEYRIAAGDAIAVQIWDHADMSARGRVRTDGRLAMPLLADVAVAGRTPNELARELEQVLGARGLVVRPRVTVVVEEVRPLKVAVLGEVARPGLYVLDAGAGVAEALASAGGFTDFAHRDRIYVVRRSPEVVRIRFTFDALARGLGAASTFRLQPGDVVVTE